MRSKLCQSLCNVKGVRIERRALDTGGVQRKGCVNLRERCLGRPEHASLVLNGWEDISSMRKGTIFIQLILASQCVP